MSSFTLPPISYEDILFADEPNKYSTDIGGGVRRQKGFEDRLRSLPFPDQPEINTIPKILKYATTKFANNQLYGDRNRNADGTWGGYSFLTYGEFYVRATQFAVGLLRTCPSLSAGSRLGIYGKNSGRWVTAQHGAYLASLTVVPLYDTFGEEAVRYIIGHSGLSVIVVSPENLSGLITATNVAPNSTAAPLVSTIIVMADMVAPIPGLKCALESFKAVETLGAQSVAKELPVASPEDLALILYTSGTTGMPKGVMLTQGSMVSVVAGMIQTFGNLIDQTDRHISYLPLAHGFENLLHAFGICYGASCGFFHGDVRLLTDDAQALQPTLFVGVPRVFQRIHQVILQTFEAKPWPIQALISRGLASQAHWVRRRQRSKMWDLLVFNRVKSALGGKVRYFFTGSAPLAPCLQEFLTVCFGAPVFEGYGMTETSAISHAMLPVDRNLGHVGPPLPCCEMKLEPVPDMGYTTEDKPCPRGEVLVRGPGIMKGYYAEPEMTREVLEPDGWLHTGDVGRFNPNGTLSIIDRKKNMFKLSQGEYIACERIEGILLQAPLVGQVCIYGDSYRDSLIAIVVPDPIALLPFANSKGWPNIVAFRQPGWKECFASLCQRAEVQQAILADMVKISRTSGLNGFQIPKAAILEGSVNDLNQGFSVENGLLTPTFKLRRSELRKRYQAQIDQTYAILDSKGSKSN